MDQGTIRAADVGFQRLPCSCRRTSFHATLGHLMLQGSDASCTSWILRSSLVRAPRQSRSPSSPSARWSANSQWRISEAEELAYRGQPEPSQIQPVADVVARKANQAATRHFGSQHCKGHLAGARSWRFSSNLEGRF